jgi:hypothetical protein
MMAYNIIFYLFSCIAAYAFTEINRRYLGFAVIFTFMVLLAFPFLAKTKDWGWFEYVKIYSLIISAFIYSFANYGHKIKNKKSYIISNYIASIVPIVLLLNLLEAVVWCLQTKYYYNAFIGGFICLMIPQFWKGWEYDKNHILGNDSPIFFTLYVLWCVSMGLTSLVKTLPIAFIPHLVILAGAIFYCVLNHNWHIFGMVRIYTIYFFVVFGSFYPTLFPTIHPSVPVDTLAEYVNVLSTLIGVYLVYDYMKHKRSCMVYCPKKSVTKRWLSGS